MEQKRNNIEKNRWNVWLNKVKNFVNWTTKPLILLTLLSTNVVFSNPVEKSLNMKWEYPSIVINYQENGGHLINSQEPVWMEKKEYDRWVRVLLSSINKYRKEKWLNELVLKHDLDVACQWYANYCINNDWFRWFFDKEWKPFEDRLKEESQYDGDIAKCRAHGYCGPKDVVQLRKDSPDQRKNLLVENWKYISIWVAKGNYDHHIVFVVIYE